MKFPIYDRPISITTPTQTYHVSVWIDSSVLAFWKGNARQHTSRGDNLDSSLKNSSQPKNHELKRMCLQSKMKDSNVFKTKAHVYACLRLETSCTSFDRSYVMLQHLFYFKISVTTSSTQCVTFMPKCIPLSHVGHLKNGLLEFFRKSKVW